MTINTNELVNILSKSPRDVNVTSFNKLFFWLLMVFLVTTSIILGVRDNLEGLYTIYTALQKTAILGCASLMGLALINKVACPIERVIPGWSKVLLPAIVAVLAMVEIYFQSWDSIRADIFSDYFITCIISVSIYGSLTMLFATWLMKKYAPLDLDKAGGAVGFAASTIAALSYSIHCPIDSVIFMIVAYGTPMMLLYLIGRFIVPKFIRW